MWDKLNDLLNTPLSNFQSWMVMIIGSSITILLIWHSNRPVSDKKAQARFSELMASFEKAGLTLNKDVNLDALLNLFDAPTYARDPSLLLCIFGGEIEHDNVWFFISDNVVNFDYECIDSIESYEEVFKSLTRLLNREPIEKTAHVSDEGVLEYQIGQICRKITPQLDDDWADEAVVTQILQDMKHVLPETQMLWTHENGQASVFTIMTKQQKECFCLETSVDLQAV